MCSGQESIEPSNNHRHAYHRRAGNYKRHKHHYQKNVHDHSMVEMRFIALLDKYRLQIEMFFKWIKQHLRSTAFYGGSANAVTTQYTAPISFCLLAMAADTLRHEGSLYELSNIMSVSFTENNIWQTCQKGLTGLWEQPGSIVNPRFKF